MPRPWTEEEVAAWLNGGESSEEAAARLNRDWTPEEVAAWLHAGQTAEPVVAPPDTGEAPRPSEPSRKFLGIGTERHTVQNPLGRPSIQPVDNPTPLQQALNFFLSGLGASYPGMEPDFSAALGGGFALGGGNTIRSGLQGIPSSAAKAIGEAVARASTGRPTAPTTEEIARNISLSHERLFVPEQGAPSAYRFDFEHPLFPGAERKFFPLPSTVPVSTGALPLPATPSFSVPVPVVPPPASVTEVSSGGFGQGLRNIAEEILPGLKSKAVVDTTTPILDETGNVIQAVRDPVVAKIAQGLNQATRVRLSTGELALARAEDISKKVAIASARETGAAGTEKIGAIKSGLFGEAPVAGHFAPPTDLELTGADVSHVIDDIIFKNPTLRTLDRLEAYQGLEKVAFGDVPTNSEIDMLGKALGLDIAQALRRLRGLGAKAREAVLDALNLPKAVKSAYDFSAPLRQGLFLVGRHPLEAGGQFKNMFQYWASEKGALELQNIITQDPLYEEISRVRPKALTAVTGSNPADREEAFAIVTDLAHNWLPGLRMSERAYSGFLNGMRFGVIKNAVANAEAAGKVIGDIGLQGALADFAKAGKTITSEQQITLASAARQEALGKLVDAVMSLSGRGPSIAGIAPEVMNIGFWSPRLITSRFSVLGHTGRALGEYATAGALQLQGKEAHISLAAKEVAQDVAATVGLGMSVLGLIKATGVGSVEADPRSPDFGKVLIGKTRYDFWGGFQQIARYTAQLGSGQSKTVGTDLVLDANQLDILSRFLRSKLSPMPGAVTDVLAGKTFTGDPASPNRVAWNLFAPLFIADIRDAVVEDGVRAGFLTAPSAFGVGAQTFNTKEDMTQLFAPGRRYKEIANPALRRQIDTAWSLYRLSESEVQDVKDVRLRGRLLRRMNRGQSLETQQANREKVLDFLRDRRAQGNEFGP